MPPKEEQFQKVIADFEQKANLLFLKSIAIT
jgi:hypothetical protein